MELSFFELHYVETWKKDVSSYVDQASRIGSGYFMNLVTERIQVLQRARYTV